MRPRRVELNPEAEADLRSITDHIAGEAGARRAAGYVRPIRAACRALTDFPYRGTRRDDLYPGLLHIGFERRVTITFVVRADSVEVLRILYGGRDLDGAFAAPDDG